jgi:NagD protein
MLVGIRQQKHLQAEEIAMVGDRIYTDIAMAFNANVLGCLVLSGETTLEVAKAAPRQPDLIVENIWELGQLLEEARKH